MKQREIKFRAWWGGKMHYDILYITMTGGVVMCEGTPLINPVLMQYIGIKDKNGVEIYEGDIYEGHGLWPSLVIFDDGVFRGRESSDEGVAYDADWYGGIDVIGNIYEQPNLFSGGN